MPIADYDIVGSYNNQRFPSIDAERSVNLFEYRDRLSKKGKALISTSGLTNTNYVFAGNAGGFRMQFFFDNTMFFVIGDTLYSIDNLGSMAILGTLINSAAGYVGVDANTFQLIIVDGVDGYIWDTITSSFTRITDTAFPPLPLDVTYLDGYFVVIQGETNQFQLSEFNQGLMWGGSPFGGTGNVFTGDMTTDLLTMGSTANYQTGVSVQFTTTGTLPTPLAAGTTYYAIRVSTTSIRVATSLANAQTGVFIDLGTNGTPTNTIFTTGQVQQGQVVSHPGTLIAVRTLHRRLFFFSQFFTEVWENQAATQVITNLPFRRNNSVLIEYGTPSAGNIATGFDLLLFVSQSRDGQGSVMQIAGIQAIPVSNRALDVVLGGYAASQVITDGRGFIVKENGLVFYRLNFTTANHTWVYDITQSDPTTEEGRLWHEEEVLNGDRHPAQTHAYFKGQNYVGSYDSPILYILDPNAYTNDGEIIRRMRIARPVVPSGYQRTRIDRFQIDLVQGNIAMLDTTQEDLDLLTEGSQEILTESGIHIILQMGITLHNPQDLDVFLSISKDGGQSYGYIVPSPMGRIGNRSFRTLWRKQGVIPRGQAFVPKIEFYEAVPFILMGASWFYEILPE